MSNETIKCWNCVCELSINEIICGDCRVPQKPYSQDPFSLFGIEPHFDLSWQQVEERYFFLLKKCHPDRFVTATSEIKDYAQNWSSQLNQAYQILKDPLSRAEVLLKKFNIIVDDNEDQQVLLEVFDWRETLLNGNEKELIVLREELLNVQEQCLKSILQAFNQKDYFEISSLLKRLSYARKCLSELP